MIPPDFTSRWRRLAAAVRCLPAEMPAPVPPGLVNAVLVRWRTVPAVPLDEWLALFGRRALCACALLFVASLGLAGWQAATASPVTAWIETVLVTELPLP